MSLYDPFSYNLVTPPSWDEPRLRTSYLCHLYEAFVRFGVFSCEPAYRLEKGIFEQYGSNKERYKKEMEHLVSHLLKRSISDAEAATAKSLPVPTCNAAVVTTEPINTNQTIRPQVQPSPRISPPSQSSNLTILECPARNGN